jgi:protein TonB
MFDTIVNPSSGVPRQRWTTTALSAVAHVAVIVLLVLSTLYATDVLPEPRDAMAFFVAAPAPPPPPPPPPAVAEPEPKPVKPVATTARAPKPAPVIAKAPVAAPIEAPSSIAPETGLEGGEFTAAGIEPGFERDIPGGIAGGIVGGFSMAPPPPPPVVPVRVGGEISTPRLVHRVEPEYPPIAVSAQIEGMVIIEATVDSAGAVSNTRVLRSHDVLDEAAIDAVRQWRYEPLRLNGTATPFILTVTVSFSLAAR